jgi:hypothetical protein
MPDSVPVPVEAEGQDPRFSDLNLVSGSEEKTGGRRRVAQALPATNHGHVGWERFERDVRGAGSDH